MEEGSAEKVTLEERLNKRSRGPSHTNIQGESKRLSKQKKEPEGSECYVWHHQFGPKSKLGAAQGLLANQPKSPRASYSAVQGITTRGRLFLLEAHSLHRDSRCAKLEVRWKEIGKCLGSQSFEISPLPSKFQFRPPPNFKRWMCKIWAAFEPLLCTWNPHKKSGWEAVSPRALWPEHCHRQWLWSWCLPWSTQKCNMMPWAFFLITPETHELSSEMIS